MEMPSTLGTTTMMAPLMADIAGRPICMQNDLTYYVAKRLSLLSLTLVTFFFETSKLWANIFSLSRRGVPRG